MVCLPPFLTGSEQDLVDPRCGPRRRRKPSVTCHIPSVTCHKPSVTCHMAPVTCVVPDVPEGGSPRSR